MRASATNHARPWELPPLPGESEADLRDRQDRAYFAEEIENTPYWWERIGEGVDLRDQRVLDFGCGHGALSVSAAQRGAREVLGIDLDRRRIDFASRHLSNQYPALKEVVRFSTADISELDGAALFDVILSKDTLEHVDDIRLIAQQMRRLLRPGGRLVVGFSPLFYSPFGDHGRVGIALPWVPALLPERLALAVASRRAGHCVNSFSELGLNRLKPAQFRAAFPAAQWNFNSLAYNPTVRHRMPLRDALQRMPMASILRMHGSSLFMPLLNALRRVPGLEPWFTVGIYAVATKR